MYTAPKEVKALARLRVDREHGEGTFDQCERAAFSNDPLGKLFDPLLSKELRTAEAALRDVAAMFGGLRLPGDASDWAKSVLGPERKYPHEDARHPGPSGGF